MVFGLKLGLPKKAPAEPPSSETAGVPPGKSGSNAKSALTVNEFVARTKRSREKGLEPTKPELIAYARYLGIDPIVDGDLMWIADEALNAPLPSEWTEHHDSADRVFYYNVQTHASSWTHPLEQLHRDTYKCIVNFRSGELNKEERSGELEKLRRKCEEAEREAHRELQAWSEHTDEQGQKFFYNREHQRSVWTDPRPARCHALYLQMKALRVLSKQLGQPAPTVALPSKGAGNRGLEPLGGADHRTASDSERSNDREDIFPKHHSRKHKDREPGGGLDGIEGAYPSLGHFDNSSNGLGDDEFSGGEGRGKRGRKKKRDRDAPEEKSRLADNRGDPLGLSPLKPVSDFGTPSPSKGGLGGLPLADVGDSMRSSSLLDMKKPSFSAVEEVRSVVGLSGGGGTRLPPMGPLGHSNPFGGARDRLPSPPTDALDTRGRAKVRAGIRLQPLAPV
jgi:hypothetical protein